MSIDKIIFSTFYNKLDEIFPACQPALEEPHDDDVMRQRHCVVVKLEGVGVRQSYGEHRHVLIVVKTGKGLEGDCVY